MSRGKPHPQDAGMRAVARVREVRELDQRLGFQQASAEVAQRAGVVAGIEQQIAATPAFVSGTVATYVAARQTLVALGTNLTDARGALESSERVAGLARQHWVDSKSRLSAVESLLERRADERRAEALKAEERDLDEISAQQWVRRQGGEQA